ncbi:MAG: hypothetical protein Q9162_007254 [Coniocarpon cinnabarinum]
MENDQEFVTYLVPELRKLWEESSRDPDNYEKWEALVNTAESQEGGLNRNSSPQAITAFRGVYDRFLAKFPLFFGYWKKYADSEFSIAGTEAAELVYERGVASIPYSVDLWVHYCGFKCETTHEPELIRELFERGANTVGIDFMAHPFWDKYIEFEERSESHDQIFAILTRLIEIPLHQYAKYYDRFQRLSQQRAVKNTLPSDTYAQFKAEYEMANGTGPSDTQMEAALRPRAEAVHSEKFRKTQNEVNKRWSFEQHIKRPYFHVTEVEDEQLDLWRRYLDFEESEGHPDRITFLYERCLVALAYYDDLWLRYARWMQGRSNKMEEVRHIYMRAACFYAPIARPQVRLQWALFEEREGRSQIAADIYAAILLQVPDMADAITGQANLQRRLHGIDAAAQVYQAHVTSPTTSLSTQAVLIAAWAKLLWLNKNSPSEARSLFSQHQARFWDSKVFCQARLEFEMGIQGVAEEEQRAEIKKTLEEIRKKGLLPPEVSRELCALYMDWLVERGTKDVAGEWLTLDREVNAA